MRGTSINVLLLKFCLLTAFIFFHTQTTGQVVPDSLMIDLGNAIPYEAMRNKVEVAFLSSDSSLDKYYDALKFQKGSLFIL